MQLSQLQKDQKAIIKNLDCDLELKQRFYSFGINKNSTLIVENISFSKNTIEINVEDTFIALRMEEAKCIEVEIL
ncbi:MAG: FeoA family protein [Arcobacteraceae bacterium]|nr:FeoA family protein [Arcobacteraceae bacterium]